MQWILQDFEDTRKLATALDRLQFSYSWHKVVPFVGDLTPEPEISDPNRVLLFGSYALRHYAERHGLAPGVFTLRPFLYEVPWQPYLLNGIDARTLNLRDIPGEVAPDARAWFTRPVSDSKEIAGAVMSGAEIVEMAQKVLALDPDELPRGSLAHDTQMMLCPPRHIQAEWRCWVVEDELVTASLYKRGARVTYQHGIDPDAAAFVKDMVAANPGYARAYVLDVSRTTEGLHLLETSCLNPAGVYAEDLVKLAEVLDRL